MNDQLDPKLAEAIRKVAKRQAELAQKRAQQPKPVAKDSVEDADLEALWGDQQQPAQAG